jgi:hypothetical protein
MAVTKPALQRRQQSLAAYGIQICFDNFPHAAVISSLHQKSLDLPR